MNEGERERKRERGEERIYNAMNQNISSVNNKKFLQKRKKNESKKELDLSVLGNFLNLFFISIMVTATSEDVCHCQASN